MRPIPVPAEALDERPLAIRRVFSAPNGDLTDDRVRPVEVLADTIEDEANSDRYRVLRIYLAPETDDVYVLQRGGWVELTLWGDSLPMFATQVWGGRVTQEQSDAATTTAQTLAAEYLRLTIEAELATCPLDSTCLAMALDRLVASGRIALPSTT